MYKVMTNMPFLQGVNGIDLARIEDRTRIDYVHYTSNNGTIIRQGAPCQNLMFLASGQLSRTYQHPDELFTYTEKINSTHIVEPESLFGERPQYKASYATDLECDLLLMPKGDVIQTMMSNDTFRMNYFNALTENVNKREQQLMEWWPKNTIGKICQFLRNITLIPEGEKILAIKMKDLAAIIDETRLNVSKALNTMEENGMLSLHRKEIYISDIALLGSEHNTTEKKC